MSEKTKPSKILDEVADLLRLRVRALSNQELRGVRAAAKRCNAQNCPFLRYDAARALIPFLDEETRERPIREREDKPGALV